MRIRRTTPIAGAVIRPGGRSAGRWSHNGCGTCAWNWGISWSRRPCAPPSLLLPSRLPSEQAADSASSRPRLAMVHPPRPPPGKRAASPEQTFLSSPMERCGVQQGSRFTAQERRREADGSLRVVYAASIRSCRPCPLREQCQWQGNATAKPRQVSVLLHPLPVGSAPAPLAGLEPQSTSACLHAAAAPPTHAR